MTAVTTRKTTRPSWQPGSLQVLLASQPRTTPTPTSPAPLTRDPREEAGPAGSSRKRPSPASAPSGSAAALPPGDQRILLEELDAPARVVGQREDLIELDLRAHAIALDDAVEPRAAVEDLGVLASLPLIDTSRPAALAPDEGLAEQSLHVLEPGRDLVKVRAAGGVVDVGR